jgi:uncharacterized SAM-binding protein YcdF (DUF218 family)
MFCRFVLRPSEAIVPRPSGLSMRPSSFGLYIVHLPSHAKGVTIVPAKRSSLYPFLVLALLLSLSVFQAPSFLFISEAPVRADAVVLFVGGETGTREKEANQLIREGFADYLIIPATGQIMKRGPDGRLFRIDIDLKLKTSSLKPRPQDELLNTSHLKLETAAWLENTHIEVLGAKRLMDNLGLRSALFVSSPYHMRRIKLITGEVFNDSRAVRYVPTRYETPGEAYWLFSNRERAFVLTEYTKIVWFFLYSSFLVGEP